jgi:hypothetical protein
MVFEKYNDSMTSWKNLSFRPKDNKKGIIELYISGVLVAKTNHFKYDSDSITLIPAFFLNNVEFPFLEFSHIELREGENNYPQKDLYFEQGGPRKDMEINLLLEYYDKDITSDTLDQKYYNIYKIYGGQGNLMYVPHISYKRLFSEFKDELNSLEYRNDVEDIKKI